jgi:glycosyltransferase involved in cell wall biosynthesis
METQYTKSPVSAIPFRKFNKLFKRMLNNGREHMVISPHMGEYMKAKYGGRYSFVMNCCAYPPYVKNTNRSLVWNIIYTGGLMLNRYVMLDEIAKCIEEINKDRKLFELHIYSPILQIEAYRSMMCDSIVFHDYIKQEEVHRVLVAGDVLLHTESFNDNIIRFTYYSLSTKIPECLASGRPLLYYGPLTVGVANFLSEEGVGIVTDQIECVKDQLLRLYHDPEYYEKVASDSYKYGVEFLDKRVMQGRLNRCLANG